MVEVQIPEDVVNYLKILLDELNTAATYHNDWEITRSFIARKYKGIDIQINFGTKLTICSDTMGETLFHDEGYSNYCDIMPQVHNLDKKVRELYGPKEIQKWDMLKDHIKAAIGSR